jgi:hypothetical protein
MDDKIIKIIMDDYLLYDKLYDMARRYSLSVDDIVNIAVKHLISIDDMMFQLRKNTYKKPS